LSEGTRAFLSEIDAWRRMPQERIARVTRMEVFGDDGASRLDFSVPEGRALAWIAEGNRLTRAIEAAAINRGAQVVSSTRLQAIAANGSGSRATTEDGGAFDADLLVGSDGADSWVRSQLGLAAEAKRYPETAVVAHFRCERPPAGVARQWFRADGILAWLPLPGDRMSIVWSARGDLAGELATLDPAGLAGRVRDAGGAALGDLALDSDVARFPLRLIRVPRITVPGAVLIGDAAHGVHPLAGQGVNLGFQDAASLARSLASRSPLERPGDLALLRRHERARRADVDAMQFVTDRLEWLFGIDASIAAVARNVGLMAVDALPWAKRALSAHAMR
jgi:ubiquinone biosynthesis UbiH/UbiF/VisC/COQ6 family hydroxylase